MFLVSSAGVLTADLSVFWVVSFRRLCYSGGGRWSVLVVVGVVVISNVC
jgi:hypothetical protein